MHDHNSRFPVDESETSAFASDLEDELDEDSNSKIQYPRDEVVLSSTYFKPLTITFCP
nr:hypothetical protein Iba_chr08bCG10670 [Ipomoea batatas]GMD29334.1 hypothetical protein Iba_chr08fCG2150 [Ipomoea batatas]